MRATLIALMLLLSSSVMADDVVAPSEPTTELAVLQGQVVDQTSGVPVEGALVMISGANGLVATLNTDGDGHYRASVAPGTYNVIFAHGKTRTSGKVGVGPSGSTLDGKLDAMLGEVIVIREKIKPPVAPKPTNYKPRATPPYSEAAVLSDAWTKAHMLLDIDETGVVLRYKFLKRPGYDLETIAAQEVSKLTFEPAKDRDGKPMRAWVVWTIEWPSAWWLQQFVGTRSAMPPVVGFPPRRLDSNVPCRGSGRPMALGSMHPTYKDCSKPDLRTAAAAKWEPAVH
jgi:Carboxypeptidase regulatory-like domain